MISNFFSRKSRRLWDNVKKHGRDRQARDDSIIRRNCSACWITKAADANSECEILDDFPRQQRLRERPSYYVIRTFPVLLCQNLS
jgi:hypothetical protein